MQLTCQLPSEDADMNAEPGKPPTAIRVVLMLRSGHSISVPGLCHHCALPRKDEHLLYVKHRKEKQASGSDRYGL